MTANTLGELLKSARIEKRMLLRDCAAMLKMSVTSWSKHERDINPPPTSETIVDFWCDQLKIDRNEFNRLAALHKIKPFDPLKLLPAFPPISSEMLPHFIETMKVLHTPD